MFVPGVDLTRVIDGRTLDQWWQYYTINVKYLETMTHEQFKEEYPEAFYAIAKANRKLEIFEKMMADAESQQPSI